MDMRASGRTCGRWGIAAAAAVWLVCGLMMPVGHAVQAQGVGAGVYTAEQARRGQQLYAAQCVTCHGDKLQGAVGPMLAGEAFLGAWGGRSLAELVEKIEKTMPLQAPGSLTREQSIDVAAHMLEASRFPAGAAPLAAASLAQVRFPEAKPAAAATAGGVQIPATANLAQLMRAITFPNANIIFNVQVKDPATDKPKPTGSGTLDYVAWGQSVYPGWQAVDQAALALIESTPLFMLPGRRCENGRPVPIQNADYREYTDALVAVAREAYKVSQSRDVDAMIDMSDKLNDACANCHKKYRDVGAEGSGLGTDRCRS